MSDLFLHPTVLSSEENTSWSRCLLLGVCLARSSLPGRAHRSGLLYLLWPTLCLCVSLNDAAFGNPTDMMKSAKPSYTNAPDGSHALQIHFKKGKAATTVSLCMLQVPMTMKAPREGFCFTPSPWTCHMRRKSLLLTILLRRF
jgi:hypothetical protein